MACQLRNAGQPIRRVQEYILANPGADLSLADRAHLSVRHFNRLFRAQVGMSANGYVERVHQPTQLCAENQ
jgi:transcriptional regulator GlxA family with amidase domain